MDKETKYGFLFYLYAAHDTYCKEVKSAQKTYDRFRKDFVNGHRKPYKDEDENEHSLVMGSITELLTRRRPLVEHYFKRDSLSIEELKELISAHNGTEVGQHPAELRVNTSPVSCMPFHGNTTHVTTSDLTFTFAMNMRQLGEVAEWLSGDESFSTRSEKLCRTSLCAEDIRRFLLGKHQLRIQKDKNHKVLMVLDALQTVGLIGNGWRWFMAEHHSLLSANTNAPLTLNQIYRNLSGGKSKHMDLVRMYLSKAEKIAGI